MPYRSRLIANATLPLRRQRYIQLLRPWVHLGAAASSPASPPHINSLSSSCTRRRARQVHEYVEPYLQDLKETSSRPSLQDLKETSSQPWRLALEKLHQKPRPRASELGRIVEAEVGDDNLLLHFENQTITSASTTSFSKLWLRDVCSCNVCVSETSGQKRFATCDIDANPKLDSSRVLENGDLELVWAEDFLTGDKHVSIYPLDLLQRSVLASGEGSHFPRLAPRRLLWDKACFERDMDSRMVTYSDWMEGGEAFVKAFRDLMKFGLIFIKGAPESQETVQQVASKIGFLQSTFYGSTWDVISKPNAENVAYTNEFLGLHQDLMYSHSPPKIQFLHCLKNDCQGGESLFSDGLRAAWELYYTNHAHYRSLASRFVPFRYFKNGNYYRSSRTVINDSRIHQPTSISWSPPFQAPFQRRMTPPVTVKGPSRPEQLHNCNLQNWHSAARSFRDTLESPENMLKYRLGPGDCVLFDNRRVLHGRTNFDTSTGHRHLRGGYLDNQTFDSAFMRLCQLGLLSESDAASELAEAAQASEMWSHLISEDP